MKRLGAILLALCLLTAASALAELAPVARSGSLAAYTDGQGQLYIPGKPEAVNDEQADGIISIDNYRLAYLSQATEDDPSDLRLIDLETLEDSLAAEDVYAACLLGEDLYFVPDAERTQLRRLSTADMTATTVHTADEAIDRLYASTEGLAFELVDQAGAYLYDPELDTVVPYAGAVPRDGVLTDSFEAYIDEDGALQLKSADDFGSTLISENATAFAVLDGTVYYLEDDGGEQRLMSYDPSVRLNGEVASGLSNLEPQLTASDSRLFTLSTGGEVVSYDPRKPGKGTTLASYDDLSRFSLPEGSDVAGLRIEGLPGSLNVYAELEDEEVLPDFAFIEFESEEETAETRLFLLESVAVDGETSAWDAMRPAAQYTPLARGSRGEAVRAIQQPLYDLGYYDYYVDGIFGPRTQWAVRLLQADLNLPDNGIADEALQRTILSGTLSPYDPNVPLPRGSRGLRVQIMQQRLRDLGYLADAADRIYGGRTQKAVQLFQQENGLAVSDRATRETLSLLYSERAHACSSYIDLYPGDTGYRVRALNNRLRELYYLESSVGSVYTSQTTSAVRVFQRTAGLPETGEATAALQQLLFSANAPEAPGYVLLCRGDSNGRVAELQRRLRELGYFSGNVTGYYGRVTQDAVSLFQQKVGLRVTGTATVRTQQLLYAPDAPVYVKPTWISVPYINLYNYEFFDDGVYYIADDTVSSGYITFNWYAEGDVSEYRVRIDDGYGNVFLDRDTLLVRTGVSVATLGYDRVYTMTVTAYPADGDPAHITTSTLRFARIRPVPEAPTVARIGNPRLSISAVARVENGLNYVVPGEISFRWHADGDVAWYRVYALDESDDSIFEIGTTTGESTTLSSDRLVQGEVYTLYVYAVPENGTMENARLRTLRFALPVVELPEPEPEPNDPEPPARPGPLSIPEISFDNVDSESDGISYLSGDTITISWFAEGSVDRYDFRLLDDAGETVKSGLTDATDLTLARSSLMADAIYTVRITAIPENGTADDGTYATARFALYIPDEDDEEPEDDDTFVRDEDAEPDENTDAPDNGEENSEDEEEHWEEAEDDDSSETEDSAPTDEPEVPETEDVDQAEEPEVPEVAEGEQPDAPETNEAGAPEEDAAPATPVEDGEANGIGVPEIEISPTVTEADGIAYVEGEYIALSWDTEGDVQAFEVQILDSAGNERAATTTEKVSQRIRSSGMEAGEVYTLHVTAVPADADEEPTEASARFALYAEGLADEPQDAQPEAEPIPEAPDGDTGAEDIPEVPEEEAGEEAVPAEPQDEPNPAAEPAQAEPQDAGQDVPVDQPQVNEAMADAPAASVTAPVITFDPVAEYVDDTSYISGDSMTMTWQSEGEVASYDVAVTDASGNVMASTNTTESGLRMHTSGMLPGEIYTLSVTANPADGSVAPATGAARFSLYMGGQAPQDATPDEAVEPGEPQDEPAQDAAPEYPTEETEPTEEAEPEYPAEEAEPDSPVEETPSYSAVTEPVITFDPVAGYDNGAACISGDMFTMGWQSEGDIASYDITVTDESGSVKASTNTENTSLSMRTSGMEPGMVYTLIVTANPVGPDIASATGTAKFTLYVPVQDTPDAGSDSAPEDAGQEEAYPEESYPEEAYQEDPSQEDSDPEDSYQEDSYPQDSYPEEAYEEETYQEEADQEESYQEEAGQEESYQGGG